MRTRSLNRRSFLQKAGSTVAALSLPAGAAVPFSLIATTPAKAWVQFVYLGMAVLNFSGVFGQKSNGDALRYAALDAKLNAVLDIQVLILESIQALDANISRLEQ